MHIIITDKSPLVSRMGTYEGVKFATKIGDETLLSDKKPDIKSFQNRQLMYVFDIPTDRYNEKIDYIITGMRKQARLPEDFPYIREWVGRSEGIEQITFQWWEIKMP